MAKSTITFTALIHREDDLYVAGCVEVGTASQGRTLDEALENLREATELYLEDFEIPAVAPLIVKEFYAEVRA